MLQGQGFKCRKRLLPSMRGATVSARLDLAVVLIAFLLLTFIEFFSPLLALKIRPFARSGYYGLC